MKIGFIILCYNAQKTLTQSIKMLSDFFKNFKYPYELIWVDDGSTDDTKTLLQKTISSHPHQKLIHYPQNKDKGFVVKTGVKEITADYFFFMDADLATDLQEIEHFISQQDPKSILIGSKVSKKAQRSAIRKLLGKFSKRATQKLLHRDIQDTQCGFKFFPISAKTLFQNLQTNGFAFDIERLLLAKK